MYYFANHQQCMRILPVLLCCQHLVLSDLKQSLAISVGILTVVLIYNSLMMLDIGCELNCVPAKDMLKSQSLVTVNVTIFGNRVFAGVIKIRSNWIVVGPKSNGWYTCIQAHTQRIMPCKGRGRDQSGKSANLGKPKIASNHPKPGERQRTDLSLGLQK